jgi:hypothetical protein
MTTFNDQVLQWGGAPVGSGLELCGGSVFFLDPTNGNDTNGGKTPSTAFKTLAVAYAALTDGKNDILYYIPGTSSITLSAKFEWGKSYTHFIGLGAPTMVGQRCRIFQLSTLTAASPLITISGSGCVWRNLYIFQGVADATSLVNVSVTGGRNYFQNVHFAGGGHATQAVDGGASLLLNGAEECTFDGCTIGVDSAVASSGMVSLLVDGDTKRCIFRNCNFTLYAGSTGAAFVEVADSSGFDRYLLFDRCVFINSCVTYAIASAFVIPAGMGSVTHRILLKDCMSNNVTKNDASDRGIVYGNMNAVTAADLSGVAVLMSV